MTIPQPTFDAAREAQISDVAWDTFCEEFYTKKTEFKDSFRAAITAAQVEWEKPLRELVIKWREDTYLGGLIKCAADLESALATVGGEKV